jgi:hypothetical protein
MKDPHYARKTFLKQPTHCCYSLLIGHINQYNHTLQIIQG